MFAYHTLVYKYSTNQLYVYKITNIMNIVDSKIISGEIKY
jgi:hypothetical protein